MASQRMILLCLFALFTLSTISDRSTPPACGQTGDIGSTSQTTPANPGLAAPAGGGSLKIEKVPAPSLGGNLLGDPTEQPIAIYFPPSYNTSTTRYPVVYFLPGYGDLITPYLDGTYQGFRLPAVIDSLIAAGTIKEMIVVIVNGRNALGGSFYTNSPTVGNWRNFITKGLTTYIDSRYRTIGAAGARGIAGHSMGGSGALALAMESPDIFGSVYAMSPGLFDDNGLSESPMFSSRQNIREYLKIDTQLGTLTRKEADSMLSVVVDSLLRNNRWDVVFTMAYGAAFSARPSANAPYISYPYSIDGDSLLLDKQAWADWESGFGNLGDKVQQYRHRNEQLKAIGIEYGTADEATWIPRGCEYFAKLLNQQKIQNQLSTFDGGHQDKLGERLTQYMLPFFSKNLLFQKARANSDKSKSSSRKR